MSLGRFFSISVVTCCSDACGSNPFVDAGANTEERYTYRADCKSHTGVDITLEGRQRTVGLRNVHGLDNQQVVVE